VMKNLRCYVSLCIFVGALVSCELHGMHKLIKPIKKSNLFDVWMIRAHKALYKPLRNELLYYTQPSRQDFYSLNTLIDSTLKKENVDGHPQLLGVFLSRLSDVDPQRFVELVCLHSRNSLWKRSYNWDGRVLDAFFSTIPLFEQDKVYEIFGLLIRYKPHNYALYSWCCKNLDKAYDYIGYDGLKKIYDVALGYEKDSMEKAYKLAQKTLHAKQRPLYFLDEKLEAEFNTYDRV
jgi:hypothetical protein